jgi:quercetin dioxygenase-like cupin family protein
VHRHASNRVAFLVSGVIEWYEPGKPPRRYEAGTMSYVETGVVYGYRVLEVAKIFPVFDDKPEMHVL